MPNRVIREGFLDSEKINSLSESEQNFFIRLMLITDDYGRFDARPELIRSRCYPITEKRLAIVSKMLTSLNNVGLITLYQFNGKKYLEIPQYNQRLRQKKEKFPSPENDGVSKVLTNDGQMQARMPESESNPIRKEKNQKPNVSENVSLTKEEYQKLIDKYGKWNTKDFIEILENYKGSSGKKYKSDYKAILSWVVDKLKKEGKFRLQVKDTIIEQPENIQSEVNEITNNLVKKLRV